MRADHISSSTSTRLGPVSPTKVRVHVAGPRRTILRPSFRGLAGLKLHAAGQTTQLAGEIDHPRDSGETEALMGSKSLMPIKRDAAQGQPQLPLRQPPLDGRLLAPGKLHLFCTFSAPFLHRISFCGWCNSSFTTLSP